MANLNMKSAISLTERPFLEWNHTLVLPIIEAIIIPAGVSSVSEKHLACIRSTDYFSKDSITGVTKFNDLNPFGLPKEISATSCNQMVPSVTVPFVQLTLPLR